MLSREDPLHGWIPLYLKHGQVHWAYMGRERFVEPFCQDTLQKLASRPFNQMLGQRTGLETLLERAESHPGLPLRGLVFHMSRCGSTLIAQALAALGDTVVLSEPPAFDTLLQWLVASPAVDAAHRAASLRGLLSALGQPRRAEDRRLFVKTDCWHIGQGERIFQAFPAVPWVFLYRNPLEVLVSQVRMPGFFTVPGSLQGHGLYPPAELWAKPLENAAWVLGHVLTAALAALRQHPGGLLLNYSELPHALDTRLAPHFNLALGGADLEAWQAVRARHSKQPHQSFQPDAADKQAAADAALREAAARWLDEPYAELEWLRLQSRQPA
jgi:hypothetical protein